MPWQFKSVNYILKTEKYKHKLDPYFFCPIFTPHQGRFYKWRFRLLQAVTGIFGRWKNNS